MQGLNIQRTTQDRITLRAGFEHVIPVFDLPKAVLVLNVSVIERIYRRTDRHVALRWVQGTEFLPVLQIISENGEL
jgi:hypothetical protein